MKVTGKEYYAAKSVFDAVLYMLQNPTQVKELSGVLQEQDELAVKELEARSTIKDSSELIERSQTMFLQIGFLQDKLDKEKEEFQAVQDKHELDVEALEQQKKEFQVYTEKQLADFKAQKQDLDNGLSFLNAQKEALKVLVDNTQSIQAEVNSLKTDYEAKITAIKNITGN